MRLSEAEIGCTGVRSGYGQVAEGIRNGLRGLGVADVENAGLGIIVNPTFAPQTRPVGQEMWCYTMWECTRIPELVIEQIDNYAGIIVPNDYNLAQFSEHHPTVHKVRMGVDPSVWSPANRTLDREFRVLVNSPKPGGNDIRKAFDLAEAAFDRAFPKPDQMDPVPVLDLMHSLGRFTDDEFVGMFHAAHCYLALSRGEGWHLLPFQMLATGAPVVLSDNPGHREWAEPLGCDLIPTHLVPSPVGGIGDSWSGSWWEADVEAAAVALRRVYDNYEAEVAIAKVAADSIASHWTWDATAAGIVSVVGDEHRPRVSGERAPMVKRRFPVRCLRNDTADIGEERYRLVRGEQIDVSADALRVLLTSGVVEKAA